MDRLGQDSAETMSARTIDDVSARFQNLPETVRVSALLVAYGIVGIGLAYALGLEPGSVGSYTGLGDVASVE